MGMTNLSLLFLLSCGLFVYRCLKAPSLAVSILLPGMLLLAPRSPDGHLVSSSVLLVIMVIVVSWLLKVKQCHLVFIILGPQSSPSYHISWNTPGITYVI